VADDLPDLRQRIAEALAEAAASQTFHKSGAAWAGFRSMWFGYAGAALSVVRPLLEPLRSRVAELEAHPVDWDAQRRRADTAENGIAHLERRVAYLEKRCEKAEAARSVTRERLDALITAGFGATTDTLRELRAALDAPAETT
jgi:hypothetical protein